MKSFLIFFAVAVITLCSKATAQGTFFNVGFGYGLPTRDLLGTTEPGYVDKNVYGSFASGLTTGANIGYMVNNNIGLDLGLWYVIGSTYEFIRYNRSGNSAHLVSGHTIRIIPTIKISGGSSNNLYAKFGPVFGIATALNDDETFIPITGGSTLYPNHKFTGGSANGWMGAFGIDISDNKKASVFIEINFFHQFFKPDLETITIEGQPTQKYNLLDEPDLLAPNVKLKPSFSFSSVGIVVGIKFSSKKKMPEKK